MGNVGKILRQRVFCGRQDVLAELALQLQIGRVVKKKLSGVKHIQSPFSWLHLCEHIGYDCERLAGHFGIGHHKLAAGSM